MPTRRSLLGRIGAALGAAGVGATAGCLGSLSERQSPAGDGSTTGPAPGPAFADRLYDPATLMEAPIHGFVSYDVGTFYERRDLYPESMVDRIEEADEEFEAFSLSELGRLTAQGYTTASVSDLDSTSGAITGGGSAFLEGSFQPEELVDLIETYSSGGASLEADGSVAGHDLYAVETEGSGAPDAALAVSSDSVGVGATFEADATGRDALTATLEAAGGGSTYYQQRDTAAILMDAVPEDPTTAAGMVVDVGAYFEGREDSLPEDDDVRALVRGLRGFGSSSTLGSEETTSTMVGVYAEGETPSQDELDAVVEWIDEQMSEYPASAQLPLDELETSVEGRTVTASLTQDTEEAFGSGMGMGATSLFAFPMAAGTTYPMGVGSASGSGGRSSGATPVAAFDFSYDADASQVRITMSGGDALTEENTGAVRYGIRSEGLSEWPLPVRAGDEVTVEGTERGDMIAVVWESPDGSRTSVLQEFYVS